MITDGTGNWHYLAIKSISALLRGVTSTHNGDFYCLNCFHSYRAHNKLKEHEQLCQRHDYCNLKLPNEENKYISSTTDKNTLKIAFIIYADLECLLFQMSSCENTPINSFTEKKASHTRCASSILTCYFFEKSLNGQKYYRGEDCIEKFSIELRSIFTKLINYEQKAMIPLTDDGNVPHENQKVCVYVKKNFVLIKLIKKSTR